MITSKTIYDLYKVEEAILTKEQVDLINTSNDSYKKLMRYFNNNTKDIKQYVPDLLLTGNHPFIENPTTNVEKFFNIQLKSLNHVRVLREQRKGNKIEMEDDTLTYTVFRYILFRFNTLLAEQIIDKCYEFYNLSIGKLGMHLVKNSKPVVNWGTSLKNKAKLVEEGIEPYYRKDALAAKEKGDIYNGVQWLDYTSPYQFYFYWKEDVNQRVRHPNIINYDMLICRGEGSVVAKLTQYRATFSEEQIINLYNKHNGNT